MARFDHLATAVRDGTLAATAGPGRRIDLWRLADGGRRASFAAPGVAPSNVVALARSHGAPLLVAGSGADGPLTAWSPGATEPHWVRADLDRVVALDPLRDGTAVGVRRIDGPYVVLDARRGTELVVLRDPWQLLQHPDRPVALGTLPGAVAVHDSGSWKRERPVRVGEDDEPPPRAVAFLDDGALVATSEALVLVDLAAGAPAWSSELPEWATCLALGADPASQTWLAVLLDLEGARGLSVARLDAEGAAVGWTALPKGAGTAVIAPGGRLALTDLGDVVELADGAVRLRLEPNPR